MSCQHREEVSASLNSSPRSRLHLPTSHAYFCAPGSLRVTLTPSALLPVFPPVPPIDACSPRRSPYPLRFTTIDPCVSSIRPLRCILVVKPAQPPHIGPPSYNPPSIPALSLLQSSSSFWSPRRRTIPSTPKCPRITASPPARLTASSWHITRATPTSTRPTSSPVRSSLPPRSPPPTSPPSPRKHSPAPPKWSG